MPRNTFYWRAWSHVYYTMNHISAKLIIKSEPDIQNSTTTGSSEKMNRSDSNTIPQVPYFGGCCYVNAKRETTRPNRSNVFAEKYCNAFEVKLS